MSKTVPFRWTGQRERAAVLCAEDSLSDRQISTEIGIHPNTLKLWRKIPEFQDRIAEEINEIRKEALRLPIAKVTERVKTLNGLRDDLLRVKSERAEEWAAVAQADATATIPAGAGTGLVMRQLKMIGSGHSAQVVEEFGVDGTLFDRIVKAQDEAARELGQRVEKQELSGQVSVVRIIGADAGAI